MGTGVMWLDGPLAVLCLLVGLGQLALLLTQRNPSAAAHSVMGFGMAAMFVPALDPVPTSWWAGAFVLTGAWFGASAIHNGSLLGEPGHHVVGAAAMLFTLLAHPHSATVTTAGGTTAGGTPAGGTTAGVDPAHAHHAGAGGGVPSLLLTAAALALAAWFLADTVRRFTRTERLSARTAAAAPTAEIRQAASADGASASPGAVATVTRRRARPPARWTESGHVIMNAAIVVMLLGMA